jgi:hypothetical protein
MRAWRCIPITTVLAMSCMAGNPETPTTIDQGLAEIRVDAAAFADITHVTVEAAGASQDLTLNQDTGTFDGTLFLPAGTQRLVARAFAGDRLIGLSPPTPVEVTAGLVTRIVVKILDLTPEAPPLYGPIFESLAYPTTTQAQTSVSFAISVVAPVGDPVTYDWTSDCPDSSFSTPHAATTGWSKATQGACTINVLAASNGLSLGQSFGIAVFPAGSGSGAAAVSGLFVTAPSTAITLPRCFITPGSNSSCPGTTTSPDALPYQVLVFNWGSSTPGSVEVSDNCGGQLGTSSQGIGIISGAWLPPLDGGVCIITARAVNGDGLVGTTSVAVLTQPGTPGAAQDPVIVATLENGCDLGAPTRDCGQVAVGSLQSISGRVSYGDGFPGSVTILDDCGGSQPAPPSAGFLANAWTVPSTPGVACTITVRASSLLGGNSEVSAHYQLQ